MKKTTIFDYLPKFIIQKKNQQNLSEKENNIQKRVQNNQNPQNRLVKSLIQKSIFQIIEEQEDLNNISRLLDKSWKKEENGFGYTDKEKIMVVSTIQDFKNNFFQEYKINEFIQTEKLSFQVGVVPKKKTQYKVINNIKYDLYYLLLALKILGEKYKIYQHIKLKLLFLKNEKIVALLCPKF